MNPLMFIVSLHPTPRHDTIQRANGIRRHGTKGDRKYAEQPSINAPHRMQSICDRGFALYPSAKYAPDILKACLSKSPFIQERGGVLRRVKTYDSKG